MTEDQLRGLKRQLLKKGRELAEILAALLEGKKPAGAATLAGQPGETPEEKVRRYMKDIQAKVDAINNNTGTYGKCEKCGVELPYVELEQLPWADRCRRCGSGVG